MRGPQETTKSQVIRFLPPLFHNRIGSHSVFTNLFRLSWLRTKVLDGLESRIMMGAVCFQIFALAPSRASVAYGDASKACQYWRNRRRVRTVHTATKNSVDAPRYFMISLQQFAVTSTGNRELPRYRFVIKRGTGGCRYNFQCPVTISVPPVTKHLASSNNIVLSKT